jgi:ribosomal 50S subunit-recycling heat shock protein
LLNSRTAKSAHLVKTGDEITIRRHDYETTARVVAVPASQNVPRRESKQLIEIVNNRPIDV